MENEQSQAPSPEELAALWADYRGTLAEMRVSKPAPGVRMVEFDEYGFPRGIGDYRRVFDVGSLDAIAPHEWSDPQEALPAGAKFIAPPSGIPLANLDVDKSYADMNEEEKEVFECLDLDSPDEYDSLADDFVNAANDDRPAFVPRDEEEPPHPPRVRGLLTQEELKLLEEQELREEERKNRREGRKEETREEEAGEEAEFREVLAEY